MRQLTIRSVVALALVGAQCASSQPQRASIGANLDEPSGWLRFEVAVFVDTDEETLKSEAWPVAPTLNYDNNSRWLTEFDETAGLLDEYPTAELIVHPNGSITVVEPEPLAPSTEADLLSENDAVEASDSAIVDMDDVAALRDEFEPDRSGNQSRAITSLSLLQEVLDANDLSAPSDTASPEISNPKTVTDDTEEAPADTAVPMEQLLTDPQTDELVAMDELMADTIGDGATPTSDDVAGGVNLPVGADGEAAGAREGSLPSELTDPDLVGTRDPESGQPMPEDIFELPGFRVGGGLEDDLQSPPIDWLDTLPEVTDQLDTVEEDSDSSLATAPPALPTAFEELSLEMLTQGLESLKKATSKTPAFSAAWVQPNDAEPQPLIVDTWLGTTDWPELQGTLRIDIKETPELSTNLWLNTNGAYMPENFNAAPPPEPETRLTIVEAPDELSKPAPPDEATFVDMSTGLSTQAKAEPADESIAAFDNQPINWGWRHSIALRQSRPLREGYIRYIDHPALQVIGVWREVTWGELYEMGEREKLKREIDTLTRALTAPPTVNQASGAESALNSDLPPKTP